MAIIGAIGLRTSFFPRKPSSIPCLLSYKLSIGFSKEKIGANFGKRLKGILHTGKMPLNLKDTTRVGVNQGEACTGITLTNKVDKIFPTHFH